MKRLLIVVLAILALSTAASAQMNGQFEFGLAAWNATGAASSRDATTENFGMQPSPSGGAWAAAISSWGGDWGAPLGTLSQTVNFTGDGILSGEIFAAAHAGDPWRNCATEVLWNGTVVASIARDADAVKWAQDFAWSTFAAPVVGTGANTLQVNFIIHFAEWTWTGADNLAVTAVPEPGSILALASGLVGLVGFGVRRRK